MVIHSGQHQTEQTCNTQAAQVPFIWSASGVHKACWLRSCRLAQNFHQGREGEGFQSMEKLVYRRTSQCRFSEAFGLFQSPDGLGDPRETS